MHKICNSFVTSISKPGHYKDSELSGFYMRATQGKQQINKTYLVIAKLRGSRRTVTVTLGRHPVMPAEVARAQAKQALAWLAQGIDPNQQKHEQLKAQECERQAIAAVDRVKSITVGELLEEYLAIRKLKPYTSAKYREVLRHVAADWLNRPITSITRDMIQERHIAITNHSPAVANYAMRILRSIYNYAIAIYEDADGKPILMHNPVDRLKHARLWNHIPRRQTVLRPHQLKEWYQAVQSLTYTDARDILLIEIFTGLRHSEVVGLRWRNVDFQSNVVLIEDTKNKSPHMLPMSTYVHDILLDRRQPNQEFVFPSRGVCGHITDIGHAIQQVTSISSIKFCEHDLRRTFETTAESLDVSYYTLKRLLNHKTGGDPTAGYIVVSAERLRETAQRIADYLALQMGMPAPDERSKNVVFLNKRA